MEARSAASFRLVLFLGGERFSRLTGREVSTQRKQHRETPFFPVIQASVAGSVAPFISSCATTAEAWCKLQTKLVNRSRTRILGLLSSLMNTKQEESIITGYLYNIKVIIDDLALIDYSLSDKEVLIHTLNGLRVEFKELRAAIQARDSPMSLEELHDKLTDYEIYLKREEKVLRPTFTA
ncbi:hypothetical protein BHE74_00004371 [Ensete ventricosum]|nr:hypothetical protein BHE74_00004371 [Ensete ventricosum]RZR78226.1 hypothetical protein BHM03_00003505 [Ensete ventricosum]